MKWQEIIGFLGSIASILYGLIETLKRCSLSGKKSTKLSKLGARIEHNLSLAESCIDKKKKRNAERALCHARQNLEKSREIVRNKDEMIYIKTLQAHYDVIMQLIPKIDQ